MSEIALVRVLRALGIATALALAVRLGAAALRSPASPSMGAIDPLDYEAVEPDAQPQNLEDMARLAPP